jgi:hypothetical protein
MCSDVGGARESGIQFACVFECRGDTPIHRCRLEVQTELLDERNYERMGVIRVTRGIAECAHRVLRGGDAAGRQRFDWLSIHESAMSADA